MAQERKKRRIVLASILKPVDDTRMFEKMAASIVKDDQFEVFIIGYPSAYKSSFPGIRFVPLSPFPRLSLKRWSAKWKVFSEISKLSPDILIFNTHELLFPAAVLKMTKQISIVYDVRENYFRNILYSESFPWIVRSVLAGMVRLKEKLLASVIDHFFLAEKNYEKEFSFHRSDWTVIENKTLIPACAGLKKLKASDPIHLIFSGTLAESTGVFRAIELTKKLHQSDPTVQLTIVGRAAIKSVVDKIQREASNNTFIKFIGGKELVPHAVILSAVENATAGILSYPPSPHTEHSFPTKLFEYLQYQLPIILERRWPWVERYADCHPFVFVDFENPDVGVLLNELKTKHFYTTLPKEISWQSEEPKLIKALSKL